MNVPLDQLYRLQDRIRFVQSRKRERDTIPAELTEVDREYREKVETVATLKRRGTEAEVERRRANAELSEHQGKLRKYQAQLRGVQNSREYGAVLNEIDAVEKLVRSAENRILELEEVIQTASKELASREEILPLASAEAEIAKLEASMHPRDRAEFQRLLEKKGGLAIVLVAGNSCSACHVKIRPAALQSLKVGREIIYCDSCKRILYYDMQKS